jgi:hypothetical protein
VRLRGFVKEFGEKYFTTDGIILFCKLCEVKVTAEKRFTVQQHCNTAKHKSCVNREFAAESRQRLLFEKSHSSSSILGSAYEFSKDLCKIMVSSNIPLHKVEALQFSKVLGKIHNSSHSHRIRVEKELSGFLLRGYNQQNRK